ncbi:MAG: radical SAM protein, partial [Candidatus Omnitrophota bacterium]
ATNGYLIDEAMARRIADSGLSSINISLDSLNASTHDYLRGVEGVYKKVSFAIEYLEKFAPHLKKGICCVIYGVNLDDIIPLVESIEKDKRLDWIYFMAAMQPNNTVPDKGWYKNEDYKYLWPIDKERVNSVIEHLIRLKNKDSKIVNPIPQLRVFASYFSNPDRFIKLVECNLSRAIHVSSTGDVFICFSYNKLGNIISGKIENLWSSEAALDIRKKISNCRKNCHFLINCFFEDDFPFSF